MIPQQQAIILVQQKHGLPTTLGVSAEGSDGLCKLHRYAWEKTGINIEVNQLLFQTPQLTIVSCLLSNDIHISERGLALPAWRTSDKYEYMVAKNPYLLTRNDLKNPEMLIPLREAYVAHFNKNHKED
ncbi:hypothetical protein DRW07_14355 [Alteromonas sediminis]|uniref:Uncharacterized protein n=1 Tax=Alteromonas sediminis TaxID=2259342 RepID=A0A3N5YAU7_9ALTE|nr:hypothetical protein [Alteromonas sediminis]RPJ65985.1 hypothetical protein DRW07_14355 [Alteromonas sediminis]